MTLAEKQAHAAHVLEDYHFLAKHDPTYRARLAARKRDYERRQRIYKILEQAMEFYP